MLAAADYPDAHSGWKLPDRVECDMTSGSPSPKPTTTPPLLKVGPQVSCDIVWDSTSVHQMLRKPSDSGGQSPVGRKDKSITITRTCVYYSVPSEEGP